MEKKKCPKCRQEITSVQPHCPGCGAALAWTEEERRQVVRDAKRADRRKEAKALIKLSLWKVLLDLAASLGIALWVSRQLNTGFWITYCAILVPMTWLFNMF